MTKSVVFAAVAALMIASPALAQESTKMSLKLGDLDLKSDAGATAALQRITRAATRACGVMVTGSRLAKTDEDCARKMTVDAVQALKSEKLLALYNSGGGTRMAKRDPSNG